MLKHRFFAIFSLLLCLVTEVTSIISWVKNLTLSSGKIYYTNSNSSSTTLWILKNGETKLTPCYLDFWNQNCTELPLPNSLDYTKITSIKQKYDPILQYTVYLFEGSYGEICVKSISKSFCFLDQNFGGFRYRYAFTPSNQFIYGGFSYSNGTSKVFKYQIFEATESSSMSHLRSYAKQNIEGLYYYEGYLNFFTTDVYSFMYPVITLYNTYESNLQLQYTYSPNSLDMNTDWNWAYYGDIYYLKTFDYRIFAQAIYGFYQYKFQTPDDPILTTVQEIPNVYDFIITGDICYFITATGILQYNKDMFSTKSNTPLNTANKDRTIIGFIGGVEAFMITEKGTNIIQFYQYTNFPNDLKQYFIEPIVPQDPQQPILPQEPIGPQQPILPLDPQQPILPSDPQQPEGDPEEEPQEEQPEQEKPQDNQIQQSSFSKVCITIENDGCELFCRDDCLQCNGSPNNCSECKPFYELNSQKSCVFSPFGMTFKLFFTTMSLFRPQKIQQVFFFLANFDNYNLHQTEYSGYFKDTLSYMDSVQSEAWNLLPFDRVKTWIENPFPLKTYAPYTSIKFQQIKRNDSMFFQSTKLFLIIYFVSTIVLFTVLNRLFHLISHLRISSYIRVFSFWLYALFLVIFQNWQQLLVLSLFSLYNFFSFDFITKSTQLISLFVISIIILFSVTIFPMFLYIYKKHSNYFLSNMNFTQYSWLVMAFQFIFIPGFETAIHTCLTQHPAIQKILLFSSGIIFSLTFFILFVKFNIFISKGIFWMDLILRSLFSFLNLVLYLRYDSSDNDGLKDLIQTIVDVVLNIFIYLLIFQTTYPILHTIGDKLISKQKIIQTNNNQP